MKLQDFLCRLEKVKKRGGGYIARCPAHADSEPSLSVRESDDRLLVHCFAGCDAESVARSMGLTLSELSPSRGEASGKEGLVAEYRYCDASGKHLYSRLRFARKRFFYKPSGIPADKRQLYRADLLGEAKQVFYVEGEKDVNRLVALGLPATTAGSASDWQERFVEVLPQEVVVLPDNDDAGKKLAKAVAQDLVRANKTVRIVELPGLPDGGDVSDWLAQGNTRGMLESLVKASPAWSPSHCEDDAQSQKTYLIPLSEIVGDEEPDLENDEGYLFRNLLPAAVPVLFVGAPKSGKSTLTLDLAIDLCTGRDFLDQFENLRGEGRVLILSREDPQRRVLARLWWLCKGKGIDPRSLDGRLVINAVDPFFFSRPECEQAMRRSLDVFRPDLVVIDSFRRTLVGDENSSGDVSQAGSVWDALAKDYEATVAPIHHLRKNTSAGESLLVQVRGSGDIVAIPRQVIGLSCEDASGVRSLQAEGNYSSPIDSVTFELVQTEDDAGRPVWTHEFRGAASADRDAAVQSQIVVLLEAGGMTANAIEKHPEVQGSVKLIRRVLRKMVEAGMIRREGLGRPYCITRLDAA